MDYLKIVSAARVKDKDFKLPKLLLALDPGETTGWSTWADGKYIEAGQLKNKENVEKVIFDFLSLIKPSTIVYEDYFVYAHKASTHALDKLFTAKLIGMIRLWAYINKVPCYTQSASYAKSLIKDDDLKKFGLYQRGQRHSRDSMRHALSFMIKNKEVLKGDIYGFSDK